MTSAGLSNILSERRNCFRGLWSGFEGFRICPSFGDTLIRVVEERFDLGFVGPMAAEAWTGKAPCCGDSTKHSSSDNMELDAKDEAPPNLKGGS